MLKVIQPKFTWTHFVSPDLEVISTIQKEHDFHELVVEDMIELSGETKVEYYEEDNVVALLLNFPRYDTQSEKYVNNPFVIVVSENYVISVAKYSSKHIERFVHTVQNKHYLEDDLINPTFDLVYDLIDILYEKSVK